MTAGALNILYVEDDAADAELFVMSLERYLPDAGLNLDICATIADAKVRIDFNKHNAAMIDWNLLDGHGTDLAEYIRGQNPNFPILFLSNVFTPDRHKIAETYLPSASLEKNYSKEHLLKMLAILHRMIAA